MIEAFNNEAARLQLLHDLIGDELASYNKTFGGDAEATDFSRRCLYRTIFSIIEAYISHLKSSALLFTIDQPDFFTESEVLALRDLEPIITDKGEVRTRPARIRLKDNLRLAFRLFGRSLDKNIEIDYSTPGGVAFTSAIKIRDRLTHPKDPKDWRADESGAKLVLDAWKWFGEHLVEVSHTNGYQTVEETPLRSKPNP